MRVAFILILDSDLLLLLLLRRPYGGGGGGGVTVFRLVHVSGCR